MMEPTAADLAQAQRLIEDWLRGASIRYTAAEGQPTWNDLRWLAKDIAQALAAARAQERARCVAVVQSAPLTYSRMQLTTALKKGG
jgi:hypothetical protein